MATKIQLKRSSTASDVPVAGDLAVGEVAVNTADGTLFTKHTDDSIKTISAGPIYQATNTNNVAGVWKATIPEITAYEDGQIIAFYPNKIDGVSGGTTFEINSLGAKTVTRPDSNETAITTHYDGTNLIFLRYVSADDYFIVHANYNTTDDYRIRYEHNVTANNSAGSGTAWYGYELLMEGIDGKFYPVTEGGSTANTNAVSTAELRVGGAMLVYLSSTNRTANTDTGSYSLYEAVRHTTMEYWNNRDIGWATAYRPWYIVATINSNGNFVLDNTSYTSFLTQDLPTSEDGKYYIHGGLMLDTYDEYRLQVNHPIYVYKNGAVREWGGSAKIAEELDGSLSGELDTNGNNIRFGDSNNVHPYGNRLGFGEGITTGGNNFPDMQIYHDATSDTNYVASQTGTITIGRNTGSGGDAKLIINGGSGAGGSTIELNSHASTIPKQIINAAQSAQPLELQHAGTTKLSIDSDGTTASDNINFGDDVSASFGAGGDLTITHESSGSHSVIRESGSGSLYIDATNLFLRSRTFEDMAKLYANGSVELYHNNSKKFETLSTGINVTGKTTTDALDVKVASTGDNLTVNFNCGQYDKTTTINMGNNSDPDDGYISYANLYNRFTFGMAPGGSGFRATYLDQDNLTLAQGQDIKFKHGSSNFYTTLTPSNNPSSKTITLPDATGTASVYKKTEFSLTPGSTSLTIGTSGHTNVYKYVLVMDRMNTSSGPNGPILNIEDTASTPADITWLGSSSVGSSFTQINSTDVYVALGNYHQLGDQIIEVWQANSTDNIWFLRLTAPNGYSGNYIIQGNSTSTVTGTIGGFTFSTGSVNTWNNVKGTLWEYY